VVAAVLVGLGVLASDGLAYRVVYLAPTSRLVELDAIGKRFAGRGPAMLDEFEEYGKHFLRDADVIAPFDGYALLPPELHRPRPTYAAWADLDEMVLDYVQRFPLIVTRRNPVASRPPASYRRVFRGDYYEVWQRGSAEQDVLAHLPLGDHGDPTGEIDCGAVRQLARGAPEGVLAVAERPSPVRLDAAAMERPPDWPLLKGGIVGALRAGALRGGFTAPAGRYRVWVRGSFGRGVDVLAAGRKLGRAEDVQTPEQMALAGEISLAGGDHTLALVRGSRGITPGNGRDEGYQAVFVEPVADPVVRRVPAARAGSLCGRRADWVELLAAGDQ